MAAVFNMMLSSLALVQQIPLSVCLSFKLVSSLIEVNGIAHMFKSTHVLKVKIPKCKGKGIKCILYSRIKKCLALILFCIFCNRESKSKRTGTKYILAKQA